MLLNVMDEANFIKGIEALPSDLTFYIYCRSGRRSQTASKLMTDRGLKVIDLKGGYNAWKAEN
jgi:rhodanese-related sulfurtransferase